MEFQYFAVALKNLTQRRNDATQDAASLRRCVRIPFWLAEFFDSLLYYIRTTLKLIHGYKLAGSMCFANVSGADDDGFTAEQLHLGGFGSERHRAGFVPSLLFEKLNEW